MGAFACICVAGAGAASDGSYVPLGLGTADAILQKQLVAGEHSHGLVQLSSSTFMHVIADWQKLHLN